MSIPNIQVDIHIFSSILFLSLATPHFLQTSGTPQENCFKEKRSKLAYQHLQLSGNNEAWAEILQVLPLNRTLRAQDACCDVSMRNPFNTKIKN